MHADEEASDDVGGRPCVDRSPGGADAALSSERVAALVHLLQNHRKKQPPFSFSLTPAGPLPLWQRIALSTMRRIEYDEEDQRRAATAQRKLKTELVRYLADVNAREERTRRQQREARAQLGSKLALSVRRFWSRRGDAFQQMQRVDFDVLKRHRDKRKQEDLLRETEELTKKLLDSILADANARSTESCVKATGKATVEEAFRQSGGDGSVDVESSLDLFDTEGGKRPLRHYQRSALHWMTHLFESKLNGILADEMGLGKTVQTIALLCYYAQYKNDWGPHLIVVPTTVVLNWKAELLRWAPGLKVLIYLGSGKERHRLRQGWTREDAFHICVTSYNLVVQDRLVFRKRAWGFLVLDEAHQVKNFMSKKWQSLFDLQAEYRLLLTGTPLQNSMMELWSLFHFLLPFASAFRSNDEFKEWFSNPVDDMITGRSSLNEGIVRRLQALIRPFMLRRLKSDVEAQLPTKSEKVIVCRLSRRQRSLYDDYMQLADTKQRLHRGGAGGVLSVLLGLRKVCNHPDLFEERPTISPLALDRFGAVSSFAVPRAALLLGNDYRGRYRFPSFTSLDIVDVNADAPRSTSLSQAKKERKKRREEEEDSECFHWLPCSLLTVVFHVGDATSEATHFHADRGGVMGGRAAWCSRFDAAHFPKHVAVGKLESRVVNAAKQLEMLCAPPQGGQTTYNAGFLSAYGLVLSASRQACEAIHTGYDQVRRTQHQRCVGEGTSIVYPVPRAAVLLSRLRDACLKRSFPHLCPTVAERAAAVLSTVQRVAVYVPAAVSVFPPRLHCAFPVHRPDAFLPLTRESLAPLIGFALKQRERMAGAAEWRRDLFDASSFLVELWPMHVRRYFSFPDRRLLIHDCGKLQFLTTALKQLRQEGHRVLIFTQFVLMLDILERFLALVGVAYLRLDGSTRAEVRQAMVDRFNEDTRITCMILSTRSGGIGLNLTGADTVVFYDSDWNPTMDLQAQDRCHRIGQTRPVTIYRLISEHTVEEAILAKARERKKLNNVVIRGGQFHAIAGVGEAYDDVTAAFAALSDPVNLRSFFHDYDEDVTIPAAATDGAGGESAAVATEEAVEVEDILAAMGSVEDAEDREARTRMEQEMRLWEKADAAERGDGDGDGDGEEDGAVAGAGTDPEGESGGGVATERMLSRKDALAAQEAQLRRIIGEPAEGTTPEGQQTTTATAHSELVEAGLMPTVRKRQREVLAKAKSPLDRLLTARYGVCREDDAWSRYTRLCSDYESKLLMNDQGPSRGAKEEEEEEEEEDRDLERFFPAFRVKYEL